MNIKWIIIGAVLVLLLVVFGRNPVSEHRKQKAEEMKGKDALVESIKEHNKKSIFGGAMGDVPMAPQAVSPPRLQYPSYMMKQPDVQPQTPTSQGASAKPAAPQQPESYYPPPPIPAGQ
jgi:hypothetical protein